MKPLKPIVAGQLLINSTEHRIKYIVIVVWQHSACVMRYDWRGFTIEHYSLDLLSSIAFNIEEDT